MKKDLRKMEKRGFQETRQMKVIAVSDPSFWQKIIGRYRIAKRWRFPGILFLSGGIRSAAKKVNFALSLFCSISLNVRTKGGTFSGASAKRSLPIFPGRPAESRAPFSIVLQQLLTGTAAQLGGGYARLIREAHYSPLRQLPSRYEPRDDAAADSAIRRASGRREMTKRSAGIGIIPRGRHTELDDIRIIARASLSLISLKGNRLGSRGGEKQEPTMSGMKIPHTMSALRQMGSIETRADGGRRSRNGQGAPALAFAESVQGAPSQTNGGSLDFLSFKRLEQEIDVIRKRVEDTRDAFSDQTRRLRTSSGGTVKSVVDLNHISDHVYREIERRIRLERERRGM
ncbi:MAG TPA: hypothetical protein VLD40_08285 [Dissulfurispiraceae bacterium]|nr:hypothetical protein [Dissulfurispiraceae bacterium]